MIPFGAQCPVILGKSQSASSLAFQYLGFNCIKTEGSCMCFLNRASPRAVSRGWQYKDILITGAPVLPERNRAEKSPFMILPGLPHVLSLLWTFLLGKEILKGFCWFLFSFLRGTSGAVGKTDSPSSSKRDHPTFTLNKTSWFIQGALECLTEKPDYFIVVILNFGAVPIQKCTFL